MGKGIGEGGSREMEREREVSKVKGEQGQQDMAKSIMRMPSLTSSRPSPDCDFTNRRVSCFTCASNITSLLDAFRYLDRRDGRDILMSVRMG